jgi:hypothetical protein
VTLSLCVFCGSSSGALPDYADAARSVGDEIGRRGWTLVYGGGRVGLMGVLADAALSAGAQVIGVIPEFLAAREVAHTGLSRLEVVDTFANRKQRMNELSDAFLSLPGGIGTLDELLEAWTWQHAGLQSKPNALLNTAGYYDGLLRVLDAAVAQGFLSQQSRDLLQVSAQVPAALEAIAAGHPIRVQS